jgi:hypothetical protein
MKKSLTEVLKRFPDIDFENLSQSARLSAIGCGKSGVKQYQLSYDDWSLLEDLELALWHSDNSTEWKIQIGFEFYEMFPSYFHALTPYLRPATTSVT